ncbi:MAG: MFS transporter [Pseudonocardia sp.]|uniref:MFS transporter n=1 Tax=Pseudonocardia sp. TaxID=60912 RepID=UPI001AD2FE9F|nr:MFS transporter [Pseudonocardia sp.]MBN9099302.1 MFS transporter [Pseudonocardia sp.]
MLSRSVSFVAVTAITALFMAASSAPTPLYVVYQQAWGFSAATLTVVFAVYVLGLLGSVLVVGALSDHVGRRPVLAVALALEIAALVLFLLADGVTVLLVARLAQGIATGAAITTLGATLVDLDPPHAPGRAGTTNGVATVGGLAVGAVGCGALVRFAPAPTHLVYALLLAGMVAAAVVVARMPETSARRPGALSSLRPRVGLPARLRPEFLAVVPTVIASWALGGLYLSLGPSVAATLFGLRDHLVGGFVVTLLCGTGAVTAFALRHRAVPRVLLASSVLLAAGTLATLGGIEAGSVALAAGGTVVAGVGFGAAALGTFGTFARIAAPAERGELFAVAYTIAYLAFSVPAVAAGVATGLVGLRPTAEVYGSAVVLLGVAALVAQGLLARRLATQGRVSSPVAAPRS